MYLRLEYDDYDIIFTPDEQTWGDLPADRIPREGAVMQAFSFIEESVILRKAAADIAGHNAYLAEARDIRAGRLYGMAQELLEYIDTHDVSKAIAAEFPDPS